MRFLLFLAMSLPAFADGGTVQLRQDSGPFTITVFTTPAPLRAGPADASIMIQDRNDHQPILDAEVVFEIGSEKVQATHDRAQNKLLYAASITLPEAGKFNYTVEVKKDRTSVTISGVLDAGPPPVLKASVWSYLAFPPIAVALFALRERLVRRRRK